MPGLLSPAYRSGQRYHMLPKCMSHHSGMLADPFVLDGTWTSRSSQVVVSTLTNGYTPWADPYLFGAPVYLPDTHRPLPLGFGSANYGPEVHRVSLHPLPPSPWPLDSSHGPLFKILGMHSC